MKVYQTKSDEIRGYMHGKREIPDLTGLSEQLGMPVGTISGEMSFMRDEGWVFTLSRRGNYRFYEVSPPPRKPASVNEVLGAARNKNKARRHIVKRPRPNRKVQEFTFSDHLADIAAYTKVGLVVLSIISASLIAIAIKLIVN